MLGKMKYMKEKDKVLDEVQEEVKELKEEVEADVKEEIDRSNFNIQNFFDDMQLLGKQVKVAKKPTFFYGDISVTNYLLWLLLAETMKANDNRKINK